MNPTIKPSRVTALLLCLIAFLSVLLSPPAAQAQADNSYQKGTNNVFLSGGTNSVPAATTNYYGTVDVTRYENVGITLDHKAMASTTGNTHLILLPTDGRGNASTIPEQRVQYLIPANGTTRQIWVTNLNTAGIIQYQVFVGNTNAAVTLTNIALTFSGKKRQY